MGFLSQLSIKVHHWKWVRPCAGLPTATVEEPALEESALIQGVWKICLATSLRILWDEYYPQPPNENQIRLDYGLSGAYVGLVLVLGYMTLWENVPDSTGKQRLFTGVAEGVRGLGLLQGKLENSYGGHEDVDDSSKQVPATGRAQISQALKSKTLRAP